ncbi:MAG: hypothetical protein GTN78_25815 [Gemmatimonadales bacterium]|nr:hypothetical protein [Gemmatimonadales bacterium]NIN12577.1 hypothetical protein [Gemmatimonadales bacterium]NIR03572.1 hypothetical protein [Gemmatimonadales bacterium]NIS65894.1 hypothetical protein [Gemmatimonadales bacterium]
MPLQKALDFARLEYRNRTQRLRHANGVCAYELRFEGRLAIVRQQFDDLFEIREQFVDRSSLGVGAGPAWDVAHEQPGVGVSFDDRSGSARVRYRP